VIFEDAKYMVVILMTGITTMVLMAKCESLLEIMDVLYNTCHSSDP